ncbi:rRNA pseudouridine synthase [Pseudanabaena sp. FACHB-1998]|uniref:pseudouridine synthase n=1 Tax=Pseudanabaena sp. FACHB-1998 TaxID=2692858 RepID=UPI0016805879|nr:pseudouridine synthase [Pseudanabaena sp. FACHB-1998]MBD2176961.1 rRNA pseudouridine synthase [Pseudanabaena sp. FACHB-1998]
MLERLQKILSRHGIASRRESEQIILAGKVWVNGKQVTELGTKAEAASDRIEVNGKLLKIDAPAFTYLLMNKPTGVVCTCDDPQGRKTVLNLLPEEYQHLYPVGRLDYNSSGALILTNDGDFANYLMHPRHHVDKTYEVWVKDIPSQSTLEQWQQGVMLEGRMTLPAIVHLQKIAQSPNPKSLTSTTQLQVILREGRNRQIRRVAEQLGHPVLALHRVAIASISVTSLKMGMYRLLKNTEIKDLYPAKT